MKNLIFDFDGTIVDSGSLIYSHLVNETNNHQMTWEALRGLPSHEVLKVLGISKLALPRLMLNIRHDFKLKLSQQPVVPGMTNILSDLKRRGHAIHIVSSNSEENITDFLQLNGMRDVVSGVDSFFTIFGKSHGIKKLIRKLQCHYHDAIYIGDETRDIQAARKAGIQSVAVTWGYNTEQVLMTYNPDYIAREPGDLLALS